MGVLRSIRIACSYPTCLARILADQNQLVIRKRKFQSSSGYWTNVFYRDNMATKAQTASSVFKVKRDMYQGVSVDLNDVSFSDSEFENNLDIALTEWKSASVRGIWFKVDIRNSSFIPILVKHGFVFHHAKETYALLTRWLPEDEPSSLPQFPHTHIGVAGFVVNEKNEVLVVKERYSQSSYWKLPGGYSNPGEDFGDTAHREVLEETGIDAEFVSVVSLRHIHQHIFQCSDIYVVCHMRPLNSEIAFGKEEIAECQWMDIEAYRNHRNVSNFNKRIVEAFLESRRLKVSVASSQVLSFKKDCYHKFYAVKSMEELER